MALVTRVLLGHALAFRCGGLNFFAVLLLLQLTLANGIARLVTQLFQALIALLQRLLYLVKTTCQVLGVVLGRLQGLIQRIFCASMVASR